MVSLGLGSRRKAGPRPWLEACTYEGVGREDQLEAGHLFPPFAAFGKSGRDADFLGDGT